MAFALRRVGSGSLPRALCLFGTAPRVAPSASAAAAIYPLGRMASTTSPASSSATPSAPGGAPSPKRSPIGSNSGSSSSNNNNGDSGSSRKWAAAAVAAASAVAATGTAAASCAPKAKKEAVPPARATISRLMLPDDANPGGNVHGGTILRLVDQAGWAAATKYVNQSPTAQNKAVASLARIEKMDFIKPMRIGEVSILEAEVVFVSQHSIEVDVKVYAENIITGTKRLTNQAHTWYVAKPISEGHYSGKISQKEAREHYLNTPAMEVPDLAYPTEDDRLEGEARYARQRSERNEKQRIPERDVGDTGATLIHVMLPSDCYLDGVGQAGTVLKLMDNAAGVASVRHCRSNVVTASLEAVDFLHPVFNGDLVEIHARPIFTSERSMDVEVNVYTQNMRQERKLATTSVFTFVSLDSYGRPQKIPPIQPKTEEEKLRFEMGQRRYLERKAERDRLKKLKELSGKGGKQQHS